MLGKHLFYISIIRGGKDLQKGKSEVSDSNKSLKYNHNYIYGVLLIYQILWQSMTSMTLLNNLLGVDTAVTHFY